MTNEAQAAADVFTLRPIGFVRGGRAEPIDDGWDAVTATIALTPEFGPEALAGLDGFSHVEVVFLFHRVAERAVVTDARRPRGRADWPKVGIFAQRGKDRPNRLGVTVCKLLGINGTTLNVAGLDAIDGTPILDIKPCMRGFLPRGDIREPDWARELMAGYWA
ncbi:MAG: SAM-dependent methyltransferase [Roseiarcus sp.]|jgi:tRNA-Thr(GGU) m(6)t(6)A37 methyltransferase TsaA|uniref:SAM-dependent methyltransferase n=1 Tax=Roseiarcus sp. TaxID=1969460 RepID=UPI003C18B254